MQGIDNKLNDIHTEHKLSPKNQFSWVESCFFKVQSAKLNTDETILMAGTEYFGETAVQPRDHIPVNTFGNPTITHFRGTDRTTHNHV